MIRVGIIGMGFMGGVHLRNWQTVNGAEVTAVCDANPIANVAKAGNLDFAEEELNLDGVEIYTDVVDMLAKEKLDAVSITLPTHLHKVISIQCLEAGVHVLCEKPMALNMTDCDAMIHAAEKSGKHLMVAHCIRFWPVYAWAKKTVEDGGYGDVLAADFSRLTFSPSWDNDSWLADVSKSGGIALDLHIHDLDFIQYLFGKPKNIKSVRSGFKHTKTWLEYDADRVVSATASWLMQESFGFEMSFTIIFEKATAIFNGDVLTVYPSTGEPFSPELSDGDGYAGEIKYFADLVSGKNEKHIITLEQARESVRMALETVK